MEKEFIISSFITLLYALGKFIVLKYVNKNMPPLKFFVQDLFTVYISIFIGIYIFSNVNIGDFINNIKGETPIINAIVSPPIFTDEPTF